jgi:hypothetical protein
MVIWVILITSLTTDTYNQVPCMIPDHIGDLVIQGILVEKGGETQLTVAIHCWDTVGG